MWVNNYWDGVIGCVYLSLFMRLLLDKMGYDYRVQLVAVLTWTCNHQMEAGWVRSSSR
jgi:hypothetical protein